MESAMELAKESFLKDEVPVGAVVVKENKIMGEEEIL
jgi:Cytosine/adenosine deaminases